jgi:hypothetical protein
MARRDFLRRERLRAVPLLVAGLMLCGGVLLGTVSRAHASLRREVRVGSVPRLPAGATPVASTAGTHPIRLTIALRPRSAAALHRYVAGITSSGSSLYRQYLTPAQFRALFAPRATAVKRLQVSLRAHGLPGGTLLANGMSLELRTTVAATEHAFSLTEAKVRTHNGVDVIYNTRAPAFDADVAGLVESVVGLSGLEHETSGLERRSGSSSTSSTRGSTATAHVATGGPAACSTAADAPVSEPSDAQGGYTADQIASSYRVSGLYQSGDFGKGVTVAVEEFEPHLASDIAAYQSCYGLAGYTNTASEVSNVEVDGGSGDPNNTGGAGEGEAALDIEQVIGLAPAAHVLVYEGPDSSTSNGGSGPYDVMAAIMSQDRAQVVSTSWGNCEADMDTSDLLAEYDLFEEAAVQGQTIIAASGDSGSEDCYVAGSGGDSDQNLAVDDPASQPLVTGVGGTSLTTVGPPPTEDVWNDGASQGAGGGGVSTVWKMSSAQSKTASRLHVVQKSSSRSRCGSKSTYCREVPDVAADADPDTGYLIYYSGAMTGDDGFSGWQTVGGTSAGAPMWAALVALVDAQPACSSHRLGFIDGELYHLAGQSESTYFDDITSGENDMLDVHNKLYAAATGYDMATGLGTPVASALAPALCKQALKLSAPGSRYSLLGYRLRLRLRANLAGGAKAPITYGASKLPKGLKLNASTGVISGTPKRLGVTKVLVVASTPWEAIRADEIRWTIERKPTVTGLAVSGIGGQESRLSFTASAGRDEPGLTEVTVLLPRGLRATQTETRVLVKVGRSFVSRTVSISGQRVKIKLKRRERRVFVSFGKGSLTTDATLRSEARSEQAAPLQVGISLLDATGRTTRLTQLVRACD